MIHDVHITFVQPQNRSQTIMAPTAPQRASKKHNIHHSFTRIPFLKNLWSIWRMCDGQIELDSQQKITSPNHPKPIQNRSPKRKMGVALGLTSSRPSHSFRALGLVGLLLANTYDPKIATLKHFLLKSTLRNSVGRSRIGEFPSLHLAWIWTWASMGTHLKSQIYWNDSECNEIALNKIYNI